MPDALRKPLAKLESKDERIAFRVPRSIKEKLAEAAVAHGDDLSTFCRDCMLRGWMLRQSEALYKSTVG